MYPHCTHERKHDYGMGSQTKLVILGAIVVVGLLWNSSISIRDFYVSARMSDNGSSAQAKILFSSPPPNTSARELSHTLQSFHCNMHTGHPGLSSPDSISVANLKGAGGTGWMLGANDPSLPVCIPYANGTCASTVLEAS